MCIVLNSYLPIETHIFAYILFIPDSYQPKTICIMPMFHAFVNFAVFPTLRAGGQVITIPKFEPVAFIDVLAKYKVIDIAARY